MDRVEGINQYLFTGFFFIIAGSAHAVFSTVTTAAVFGALLVGFGFGVLGVGRFVEHGDPVRKGDE